MISISVLLILLHSRICFCHYEATWESLDSRPLPKWYDEAKVGIFLHWGVYSVPGFGNEWFWRNWKENVTYVPYVDYMKQNYPPGFTYQEFAPEFTAKFFAPDDWATLFKRAGAKYVVLTSKHHEGFTLWPSSYSYSWNSVDVGPNRDLLDELGKSVRAAGLRMGYYYSLLEWYNPLYVRDKAANFTTTLFSDYKAQPELRELVERYKPDIVWADGEWEANDTYWKSREFLAWLYNDSPVREEVVTNDRWGSKLKCVHGGFLTCKDRYNPGVLQPRKWENAMTIDEFSWGYRENGRLEEYKSTYDLIATLVQTVSCGGNILINVGPTKEGMIIPIFQERLLDLGKWLDVNGEAIYGSVPWKAQSDPIGTTWYTAKNGTVYAICLNWPRDKSYPLASASELFESNSPIVELLGYGVVTWNSYNGLVTVTFPDRSEVLGDWAWVLKITNVTVVPEEPKVQDDLYTDTDSSEIGENISIFK